MFKHTCKENPTDNKRRVILKAPLNRPDTRYIYVNVGFGFHVQFTLDEAKAFIVKKEAHLQG